MKSKNRNEKQPGWLRRTGIALLWCFTVLAVLVLISLVGIALAGNVEQWQAWMDAHSEWFLLWRLVLYANIAAGWLWMRRRVLQREQSIETRWRLSRVELACILIVSLLEITQAMKGEMA